MRLLLATHFGLTVGGLGQVVRNLGEVLSEMGVTVTSLSAEQLEMTVPPATLRPRRRLPRMAVLGNFLRQAASRRSFDVVACQDIFSFNAALGSGLPSFQILHGFAVEEWVGAGYVSPGDRGWRYVRFLEKRACKRSPVTVAVSRALSERVRSLGGRVVLLPNGVDTEFFHPVADQEREVLRCRLGFGGRRLIVFAGRLVNTKGVDVLLRAMALLPEDYLLAVAGDGDRASFLKWFSMIMGIDHRVFWLGQLDRGQLRVLFQVADAACFPSVPLAGAVENCSLALLEAMSCGAPVLASAIGGLAENVRDGLTGRLVPPGDAAALAKNIAQVAGTDAGRRMGEEARRWVVVNRDRRRWARKFRDIARGVMEQAASQRFLADRAATVKRG